MKLSQTDKLYNLLKDGQPHRTDEILDEVYGIGHAGIARISARILDLKRKHGVIIKSWRDPRRKTLWWYQIV